MSTIAIIQPTTLLANELREALEARPELWSEVKFLSTDPDDAGTLTDFARGATIVQVIDEDALANVDVAFFCGPASDYERYGDLLPSGATSILVSPRHLPDGATPVVDGVDLSAAVRGMVLASPHPAAIALAHLLKPLNAFSPRRASANVVLPTSIYGNEALHELFEQARRIIAMAGASEGEEGEYFPHQLAFNTYLAEGAPSDLADIVRQTTELDLPLAIEVVQGAVFHSITVSLWVDLAEGTTESEVREALAEHALNVRFEDEDIPVERLGPINAAARNRVLIGRVRQDPQGGFWIWATMDNLTRGGTLNAIAIAEAIA